MLQAFLWIYYNKQKIKQLLFLSGIMNGTILRTRSLFRYKEQVSSIEKELS